MTGVVFRISPRVLLSRMLQEKATQVAPYGEDPLREMRQQKEKRGERASTQCCEVMEIRKSQF